MIKNNTQPNGFTLIELLIYMSIVTIGLVILTNFLADVTKNAARARTTQELQQNARLVMARLTQDIRTADSIDTVSPSTEDHGSITVIKNSIPIAYSWDTNQVSYSYNNSAASIITTNKISVSQLRFAQSGNTISIQLTFQPLNTDNPTLNQVVLSSAVVPRPLLY
jgi:prepilin-type N-terminal cleavage/methylation domain-containing protein